MCMLDMCCHGRDWCWVGVIALKTSEDLEAFHCSNRQVVHFVLVEGISTRLISEI